MYLSVPFDIACKEKGLRGIDSFDYEADQKKDRLRYRFTINFKTIYMKNAILLEDNSEWDEKYPKNILCQMIIGIWLGMFVLFAFSKGILLMATLPFVFFYIMALNSTYKVWKEYRYKKLQFWLYNFVGLTIALALGILVQIFVLRL